ncbi:MULTISPECIES: response regulator [Subtercola]|uniref:Transcriptional regulatory protein n=1 Tax=Subtercola vilae TaxID=2056433 RepID=A0A4T2C6Q5_9MICO|nr:MULTISPECIES: response regulator [Subtercola]MEA9984328.1 response regulator [Subtercola sp. RTI3]TIH40103.1 response regulator [Subtercola vilae]
MTADPLTVLIVDDDFRVASVHHGFVEKVPGFVVVGEAHTATEALEMAERLHPDLVLMDIYLPDGDGLDVTRALLDSARAPIVFVISAATDVEAVRTAIQLGVVHYLVKPFGFAALAERLGAVRAARAQIADWPSDASQQHIDHLFDLLRPARSDHDAADVEHLAPTLQLVYKSIGNQKPGLSASEIAALVGISRATAQRYLAQLENLGAVSLELRYGQTGRPEHRYSLRHR